RCPALLRPSPLQCRRSRRAVLGKTNTQELPARVGVEKAAVARADVVVGGDAGASAHRHLVAHELAVVLSERTGQRPEAGVRGVGRGRPFPVVPEVLPVAVRRGYGVPEAGCGQVPGAVLSCRGNLPLLLRRQARACPASEGVGLVIAHMSDRGMHVEVALASESELRGAVHVPVQWPVPTVFIHGSPAVCQPKVYLLVAAVPDELQVFPVRDLARPDPVLMYQDPVTGQFVVESEALTRCANLPDP